MLNSIVGIPLVCGFGFKGVKQRKQEIGCCYTAKSVYRRKELLQVSKEGGSYVQ